MLRALAVVSVAFFAAAPVKACEGLTGAAAEIVSQIEAKFPALKTQLVSYKCGGSAVDFLYKPPRNLVPADSFFKGWNREFSLGALTSDSDFKAMLALTPAQMDALIEANISFINDVYETGNRYGIHASHPNALAPEERLSDGGMRTGVRTAHCDSVMMTNSFLVGDLQLPVYSLEGVSLIGRVPFYKRGDLMRALTSDPSALKNLQDAARDNKAAVARDPDTAIMCARGMERGAVVDWDAVLELLPPGS